METSETSEPVNSADTLQPEETAELLEETNHPQPEAMQAQEPQDNCRDLEFLFDVPLQVSVEVGRARILLKDLLQMGEGYVVELDKFSGDPLDLYVNSRLIARGEAVKVGDKFGIKLTEVVSQSDRIARLG
ncbi:MAG TPA: flagellar motor switch protein FliN [Desulfobulbaceae bacterium]|nr:flagellar motor switch protein FliN [Desulfobulbaceae bacterium]